jgi:ABC-2 type transport system permease protein
MRVLRDTWLVFQRSMGQTLRNPVWVVVGLMQPLYYLFLFGPVLKPVAQLQGFGGTAYNVFVPALLIQMALFGSIFVGFGLIAELRFGVIERMRVTPMSRLAMLLGRAARDIVILIFQSSLLMLMSIPFGLHITLEAVAIIVGLLVLLGLGMACLSYGLALLLKSEDAMAPLLNAVFLPVMLLSGMLLPLTLAPRWLQGVSHVNPLTYAVDAARQAFATLHPIDTGVVLGGLAVAAALAAVTVTWAARSFGRSVA